MSTSVRHSLLGAVTFLFALQTSSSSVTTTPAFLLAGSNDHSNHQYSSNIQPARTTTRTIRQLFFSQSNRIMEETEEQSLSGSYSPQTTLRILALHGSEGDANEFPRRLSALNQTLMKYSINLDITAVEGPFPKGSGFSWWTMPPGVRSFNAKEYEGFEESATRVLDCWKNNDFDMVLGHSQGAILIASLLALNRAPYHPKRGYIFNGVSFPNPYTQDVASLTVVPTITPSLPPKILFILGQNDKITPNASGEQLREGLSKAGFQVDSCYHKGGHGIPLQNDPEALTTIARWIYDDNDSSTSEL
ncbi:serine hydrolase [Nitzschia inconspicua]|uniref:Serine hydrolase n=1 Tax=Nitzschia inconspicua TaxID=303405 RepID=A0A9K3KPC2_9STRA|nr:serine hydrolase [Nitzschia inconspicua]